MNRGRSETMKSNLDKGKDIAPQTAAAYERALDKQAEEITTLKEQIYRLTQWQDIRADPKWGFATDDALDEIFLKLPRLIKDKRYGCIELLDYDNSAEWRGDLERKPSCYQWQPIPESGTDKAACMEQIAGGQGGVD